MVERIAPNALFGSVRFKTPTKRFNVFQHG